MATLKTNPVDTPHGIASSLAIVYWGIGGVAGLLFQAVLRLTPHALAPWFPLRLLWWQMIIYFGWLALNGYLEGYRAFQLRFCPRVLDRALALSKLSRHQHPFCLLWQLLAPLYCMSLIAAPKKRMFISWGSIVAIVGLVIIVRGLPQPWRGIIDGGVVVGLLWGFVVLLINLPKTWITIRTNPG